MQSTWHKIDPIALDVCTFVFALSHLDGTTRLQSVGHDDEPWIHSLLIAVGEITGLAALINTSFNTKGKPIINDIAACLELLDTLPDLDYLLIDDL